LVTNGDFETALGAEWNFQANASGTIVSGELQVTLSSGTSRGAYQDITTVAGKRYIVQATGRSSGGILACVIYTPSLSVIKQQTLTATGSNQSFLFSFVATGTTTRVFVQQYEVGSTLTTFWDNISVRELPGNHATQIDPGARPTLARVPEGGRRNLLERTEEFDNAWWSKLRTSVDTTDATAPDGTATADKLTEDATSLSTYLVLPASDVSAAAGTYTASVYLKEAERRYAGLQICVDRTSVNRRYSVLIDLRDGGFVDDERVATPSGTTYDVTPAENGWYRLEVTSTHTTGDIAVFVFMNDDDTPSWSNGNPQYTGDGTSGIYIWGAQLEEASSASAYQRVVDQYDITEAGVTSLDYLSFDGSDDVLSRAPFAFTEELSFFGVYDGAGEMSLSNVSVSNNYIRSIGSNNTASSNIRDTSANDLLQTIAPAKPLVGSIFDGVATGGAYALRVNGVETDSGTSTATPTGIDTFAIGALLRAGSAYKDGGFYGGIVVNRTLTTAEITNTEAYLATRSGAILPAPPAATGGTETVIDASGTYYRVHTFLTDGTLEVTQDVDVEYLVVAGGGGGGDATQFKVAGGGGGAGGFLTGSTSISTGTYPITVGAGGISGTTTAGIGLPGGSGENSVFSDITAIGGGGAAGASGSAASGGSGGGGGSPATTPASGTAGQGFGGGAGDEANTSARAGGGGGGASEVGADGLSHISIGYGGAGGDGLASAISGSSSNYAGGGGGGFGSGRPAGSGGLGGGGNGGNGVAGQAGQANTGGGGGGAGNSSSTFTPSSKGGNGGSGIVIVRYEITAADYLAGL
jgi:hypothetical protein